MGNRERKLIQKVYITKNGGSVSVVDVPERRGIQIRFSRRVNSEIFGNYRDLESVNKFYLTNFNFSKNKRSLVSYLRLGYEPASLLLSALEEIDTIKKPSFLELVLDNVMKKYEVFLKPGVFDAYLYSIMQNSKNKKRNRVESLFAKS